MIHGLSDSYSNPGRNSYHQQEQKKKKKKQDPLPDIDPEDLPFLETQSNIKINLYDKEHQETHTELQKNKVLKQIIKTDSSDTQISMIDTLSEACLTAKDNNKKKDIISMLSSVAKQTQPADVYLQLVSSLYKICLQDKNNSQTIKATFRISCAAFKELQKIKQELKNHPTASVYHSQFHQVDITFTQSLMYLIKACRPQYHLSPSVFEKIMMILSYYAKSVQQKIALNSLQGIQFMTMEFKGDIQPEIAESMAKCVKTIRHYFKELEVDKQTKSLLESITQNVKG